MAPAAATDFPFPPVLPATEDAGTATSHAPSGRNGSSDADPWDFLFRYPWAAPAGGGTDRQDDLADCSSSTCPREGKRRDLSSKAIKG